MSPIRERDSTNPLDVVVDVVDSSNPRARFRRRCAHIRRLCRRPVSEIRLIRSISMSMSPIRRTPALDFVACAPIFVADVSILAICAQVIGAGPAYSECRFTIFDFDAPIIDVDAFILEAGPANIHNK